MNLADQKYAMLLASEVDRFVVKMNSPLKINFRCPICGDSKKSETKARGWLIERKGSILFHCYNCGVTTSLGNFLKENFPNLYDGYIVDRRLEGYKRPVEKISKKILESAVGELIPNKKILKGLTKISSLPHTHYAKQYIVSRKIPSDKHYLLYHAEDFNAWTNSLIPGKLIEKFAEPRLVIPFRNEHSKIVGYTGRSYAKTSKLRYISIMLDYDQPKMFGLDRVDTTTRYYVFEGPIDSLFIPNAVAMAAADSVELPNVKNAVFVYDFEYKNREIVKRIEGDLDKGRKVCIIYRRYVENCKDINDLILSGMTSEEVKSLIDNHIYSGIEGKLRLIEEKS